MSHARTLKTSMIAVYVALLTGGLFIGGLGLKECRADELAAAPPHASPATLAEAQEVAGKYTAKGYDFLAIALCVGLACLGAGHAVAKVGSAAMGAIVEKPELMGRALIFVGLAEGIAIYGLIFGVMLLRQL